ncbi:MAG: hypothetical protein AABW56_03135 [Nanoarchaeota archaeon]
MKKLLLILLTLFISFNISKGQNNQLKNQIQQQYHQQNNTYETEVYIDWKLSNEGGYGIPSFFWLITRSRQTYNGYYLFDVWFYSNSYLWDYYSNQPIWSYTYVNNIYLLLYGEYANKEPVWVTFQGKFTYNGLRFYSMNKFPRVNLIYDNPLIP